MKRKVLFPILVLVIALTLVFSAPALAFNPGTVLTVSVSAAGVAKSPVTLTITDYNSGDQSLDTPYIDISYGTVTDTYDLSDLQSGDNGNGRMDPGESWTWEVTYFPLATVTYTITGHASFGGLDVTYPDWPNERKIVTVTITEEPGQEGLTPGFWKNHLAEWANTAYSPTETFRSVFGVGPTITLLEAVSRGGGGEKALGRHAVAALLNASHPLVDYPMTEAAIIAAVRNAYATGNFEGIKNVFESYNELEMELGYNSPNVHNNKPKK